MTKTDQKSSTTEGFYWEDMTPEEKLDTAMGIAAHVAAGGILGLVELAVLYMKLFVVAAVMFLIVLVVAIGLLVFN